VELVGIKLVSSEQKKLDDLKNQKEMRLLAKYNIFLLIVIVVTLVTYYQVVFMFELSHEQSVQVSIIAGLVFAGLVLLSFKSHKKKEKKNEK
jgi:hypothetical protein